MKPTNTRFSIRCWMVHRLGLQWDLFKVYVLAFLYVGGVVWESDDYILAFSPVHTNLTWSTAVCTVFEHKIWSIIAACGACLAKKKIKKMIRILLPRSEVSFSCKLKQLNLCFLGMWTWLFLIWSKICLIQTLGKLKDCVCSNLESLLQDQILHEINGAELKFINSYAIL